MSFKKVDRMMEDLRTECSGCGNMVSNMVTSVEIQEDIDIGPKPLPVRILDAWCESCVDAEASGRAVRVWGSRRLYFFNDPRGHR